MTESRLLLYVPNIKLYDVPAYSHPADEPAELRQGASYGNQYPLQSQVDDFTTLLVVSNIPQDYRESMQSMERFALLLLTNMRFIPSDFPFTVGATLETIYFYGLTDEQQATFCVEAKRFFGELIIGELLGVHPQRYSESLTDIILGLMSVNGVEEFTYEELEKILWRERRIVLTIPLRIESDSLIEVLNGDHSSGVRRREPLPKDGIGQKSRMYSISLRLLSPIVKRMVGETERDFDGDFLDELENRIDSDYAFQLQWKPPICLVSGEGEKKPLEHLVTCVPGVEVFWIGNRKLIRNLCIIPGERDQANNCIRMELVSILKNPRNRFMTIEGLKEAHNQGYAWHWKSVRELEERLQSEPRYFDVIRENGEKIVTLSHRQQMKRFCSELSSILDGRYPKTIVDYEIPSEFMKSPRANGTRNAVFCVADFNVCYLDDLVTTIPSNWTVRCKEYIDTEGNVQRRKPGEGEDDLPAFANNHGDTNTAWKSLVLKDCFRKNIALIGEQLLNMFRGDPTATELLKDSSFMSKTSPAHLRLQNIARQRSRFDEEQPNKENTSMKEFVFNDIVPQYHRFYNHQLSKDPCGVKLVMDIFDELRHLFVVSSRQTNEAVVTLTPLAKRIVIERQFVELWRLGGQGRQSFNQLKSLYRKTLAAHEPFNEEDFRYLLASSSFIRRSQGTFELREAFSMREATRKNPDVLDVIRIFMKSYKPVEEDALKASFFEATKRQLNISTLEFLLDSRALIRVKGEFETTYDLIDTCRFVRNIVYQMNSNPVGSPEDSFVLLQRPLRNGVQPRTIESLLDFSGDFFFPDVNFIREVLDDFDGILKKNASCVYRLHESVVRGQPEVPIVEATDHSKRQLHHPRR